MYTFENTKKNSLRFFLDFQLYTYINYKFITISIVIYINIYTKISKEKVFYHSRITEP